MLTLALPQNSDVSIEVFDYLGRKHAVYQAQGVAAGFRNITLRQILGNRSLSAGVYMLRIKAGGFSETQRVLMLGH